MLSFPLSIAVLVSLQLGFNWRAQSDCGRLASVTACFEWAISCSGMQSAYFTQPLFPATEASCGACMRGPWLADGESYLSLPHATLVLAGSEAVPSA